MTSFVLAVVALTLIVLALVAVPLLRGRRTQPAFDTSSPVLTALRRQRQEIEEDYARGVLSADERDSALADLLERADQELPQEPAAAAPVPARHTRPWMIVAALVVLVPAVAVTIYLKLGTPAALDPEVAAHGGQGSAEVPPDMSAAIDMLAKKLTDRPDDAEGWSLLGRSYYAMQRFPEAVAAFEKAMKARKDDPDLLANYADALGMTQGRSLVGKPQELAQQALKINPHHPKALALAASAELEQKHVEASLGYWRRLQAEYPAGSEEARDVAGIMEDIRPGSSGATASAGPSAKVAESGGAASGGPGVSGTVEITSKFTGKADPNDTVFIYARSAEGPRMPLSIQRITVKDLPRKFSLDDSMGMAGGPKLSQAASVKIEARISKSGNAMPQPGDLTGEAGPVKPGARDVAVLIDHIVQ